MSDILMVELLHIDCMIKMAEYPDKFFDLAIVDPPYGIGAGSVNFINGSSKTEKPYYRLNDWDIIKPDINYFNELKRISINQIVWGGNYFTNCLFVSRGWVVWDKTIHGNSYSDCELAWTSFDMPIRYYRKNIAQVNSEGRFHPTQKPITLYKWLLSNYAQPTDKIIDTHLGSGSSAIAAYDFGCDFVGMEIDKEYFDAALKRFETHKMQQVLTFS
jgi:site-specific DNA-methyltransferase (adenine-specific)